MIIAPSLAEKQAAREHRRTRRRPYITAVLFVAAFLALSVALWPTTLFVGWSWWAAGFGISVGVWACGRLMDVTVEEQP